MILVSGPLIARLCLRTRNWAHEVIKHGRFGSAIEQWGVRYVDFERVERVLRRVFSDSQVADATEGRPDRIITIKENTGCPEHHRTTRVQAEQQQLQQIERRFEELEGRFKEKLLADDEATGSTATYPNQCHADQAM
jgi:hypothetical protein